jgi:hypothetical protein
VLKQNAGRRNRAVRKRTLEKSNVRDTRAVLAVCFHCDRTDARVRGFDRIMCDRCLPLPLSGRDTGTTIRQLVGTWHCVTTDTNHKTWHIVAHDTMFGPWLRKSAAYPTQNGQQAGAIVKFSGFDSDQGRWIVTSVQPYRSHTICKRTQ